MLDLSKLEAKITLKPHRWVVYGGEGAGKSTLASQAPSPLFLCAENGAEALPVRSHQIKSYQDLTDAIQWLYKEEHDYETIVIDTMDALEKLVCAKVVEDHNSDPRNNKVETIGEINQKIFKKGTTLFLEKWSKLTNALDALRNKRNLNIILLAHSNFEGKVIQDPINGSYTKFDLKLDKDVTSHLVEWADCVFFLCKDMYAISSAAESKKGKIRMATDDRVIITEDNGRVRAKNRFRMPAKVVNHIDKAYNLLHEMIVEYVETSNSNIVSFKKPNEPSVQAETEDKERDVSAYLGAG